MAETNIAVIEHALSVAFDSAHPLCWPTITPKPPWWWQRSARCQEAKINAVFDVLGYLPINQSHRDRYWAEVRKGQSVHEDAGGYGLRQWLGALGLPTEKPITYAHFLREVAPMTNVQQKINDQLNTIVRHIEQYEPGFGVPEIFDPRFCKTPRIVAGLRDYEEFYALSLSDEELGRHVDVWKNTAGAR